MAFAVACLVALTATPAVIRVADALRLHDDLSDRRRVHRRPVPRLGGIAIFAATIAGLLASLAGTSAGQALFSDHLGFFVGLAGGGALLFVTGVVDDLRNLRPATKLMAQVVAAVLAYQGGIRIELIGLGTPWEFDPGWMSLPLTVLWIVGVTNAINLIDGLDGLATGVSLVALSATVIAAALAGHAMVLLVATALFGALLGFLRYNFNPARIFLGDGGSLFIGFTLAALSVQGSFKSATALVVVPLCALALPLLDTSLAMLRRWLRGIPMSGADARHIHHRLLAYGLSHRNSVLVLYLVATTFAATGLALAFASSPLIMTAALASSAGSLVLVLVGVRVLGYYELTLAAQVLLAAPARARRIIRDKIQALDLAQVLSHANTLEEVRAIVADSAADFGFAHMEVCRAGVIEREWFESRALSDYAFGKFELPLSKQSWGEAGPYVLRIWCEPAGSIRPLSAERVARLLAPALQARIETLAATEPAVHPERELHQAACLPELHEVPGLHVVPELHELSEVLAVPVGPEPLRERVRQLGGAV